MPRVFAYESDENNLVSAAFMPIELLPGIVAIGALGGHIVYRGVRAPTEFLSLRRKVLCLSLSGV